MSNGLILRNGGVALGLRLTELPRLIYRTVNLNLHGFLGTNFKAESDLGLVGLFIGFSLWNFSPLASRQVNYLDTTL